MPGRLAEFRAWSNQVETVRELVSEELPPILNLRYEPDARLPLSAPFPFLPSFVHLAS